MKCVFHLTLNLTLLNHFSNNFDVPFCRSFPVSDDDISIEPSAGVLAAKLLLGKGAPTGQGSEGRGAGNGLGRKDGHQWKGHNGFCNFHSQGTQVLTYVKKNTLNTWEVIQHTLTYINICGS